VKIITINFLKFIVSIDFYNISFYLIIIFYVKFVNDIFLKKWLGEEFILILILEIGYRKIY
jgi:hypothetical protein